MLNSFKDLKIKKKLSFGFGFIIFVVMVLVITSVSILKYVDDKYTQLDEGAQSGENLVLQASRNFAMSNRVALDIIYSKNSLDATNAYDEFNYYIQLSEKNLSELTEILTLEKNEELLSDLQILDKEIHEIYEGLILKIYNATKEDTVENAIDYIAEAKAKTSEVNKLFDSFVDKMTQYSGTISDNTTKTVNKVSLLLIIVSSICILISIMIAVAISKMIQQPIINLSKASKKIADGDFSVSLSSNSKDEIGALSNDIDVVVNIFKTIILELESSTDKINSGDMNVTIDESNFKGEYRKVIYAINSTFANLNNEILDSINCIKKYADGNFDEKIRRFSGDKALLHQSLDNFQSNLKSISADITKLTSAASAGILDAKIEEKNYKGEWFNIASGLNQLLEEVRKPISEVSSVLEEVANGKFHLKIQSNYSGEFNKLKESVNKTVSNTSEYIEDITNVLTSMSNQNLDIHINKDYIGEFHDIKSALNVILETFNLVMSDFNSSGVEVALGARQISESSMSLAQGATEQASAVEELFATISIISEKTSENATNAKTANEFSLDIQQEGVTGKNNMNNMLTSMSGIESAATDISKIIKVIDDIAFQTNLLALNAAVEAARAGTHGKGFAVVAEEVRNLATKSQQAATEVSVLIKKTVEIVSQGTKNAENTAYSLNEMTVKVDEISNLIKKVATASVEQEVSIFEINKGISQIAQVTQSNTATSEETASSSEELSSQADIFRNSLSQFRLRNR